MEAIAKKTPSINETLTDLKKTDVRCMITFIIPGKDKFVIGTNEYLAQKIIDTILKEH